MPTAEAHVPTERASRYLQQLCSHASRMRHGHGRNHAGPSTGTTSEATSARSDVTGRIARGTAICDLTATPTGLSLRASVDDEEQLKGLQEAVTRTVERVGRRDGLRVVWR